MTKIYALQTATMIGCALEGTAEWFMDFHSPHQTQDSALAMMIFTLNEIRDEDLVTMRAEYPQDKYCEADYAIRVSATTEKSSVHELVRRNGTDMIALAQMVITEAEVLEAA